jgi:hypothetical protein
MFLQLLYYEYAKNPTYCLKLYLQRLYETCVLCKYMQGLPLHKLIKGIHRQVDVTWISAASPGFSVPQSLQLFQRSSL